MGELQCEHHLTFCQELKIAHAPFYHFHNSYRNHNHTLYPLFDCGEEKSFRYCIVLLQSVIVSRGIRYAQIDNQIEICCYFYTVLRALLK